PPLSPYSSENSTLGVVATDATLTKEQCARLATMGHAGMARAIRPVNTPVDGDIVFALATCETDAETDLVQLGALAARAVERAIVRGVQSATGLAGVPSASEWPSA
ncbi:MAG TPA: P1 family peptidase, partial [Dehalococcoidia bacterium]